MTDLPDSDRALMDLLSDALDVPVVAPTGEERAAVRTGVLEMRRRSMPVRSGWRRSHPVAWRLAAAGTAVVAATGAYLATNPLPRPVRVVAYAVGLPVTSPDLVDARHSVSELRQALSLGDREQVARDLADVQRRVSRLDHHDREAIAVSAGTSVAEAERWLSATGAAGGPGTTPGPPGSSPTRPGSSPTGPGNGGTATTTPAGEHHGSAPPTGGAHGAAGDPGHH